MEKNLQEKPTPNRSTLLRFVAADTYIYIVQLINLNRTKLESATIFISVHCTT